MTGWRRIRGFTLAELVLVLIILGVVGALVVPSIANITSHLLGIGERAELEEQAGLALEHMVQELRIAEGSACVDGGGTLQLERSGVVTTYAIHDGALLRQRGGNAERLIDATDGLALNCSKGSFGLNTLTGIALTDAAGLEVHSHVHIRH